MTTTPNAKLAQQRKELQAQIARLIAAARRQGRPTSYRQDEEIDALRTQIKRLDAVIGRKGRASDATQSRQLAFESRLAAPQAAGGRKAGRRSGSLPLYQARALALGLKSRKR